MKIKASFILIYLFHLLIFSAIAQTFTLQGNRTYGGSNDDIFQSLISLPSANNYQLLIAGISNTYLDGDKTDVLCDTISSDIFDTWLLKIDSSFNIIWQDDIGGKYKDNEPRLSITITGENYMFACKSRSDSSCDKTENCRDINHISEDYWVYMSDSSGHKIWDKTLGGAGPETFAQIIPLTTGDFIAAGVSNSAISGDKTVANHGGNDFWVVKLDSAGNKLWDKVYGGTGQEGGTDGLYALPCAGGNFILAGETGSPADGDVSDTSRGVYDVWIIKLDSSGTKLWDKRYGGSQTDYCRYISPSSDGGYILCGATSSPQGGDVSEFSRGVFDAWVIKIDSLGNKQWDKRYGGIGGEAAVWIEPAPGGGYWVGGNTTSDVASYEVSEPTYGASDYWVFKIDSIGNKICDKRFGSAGGDVLSSLLILPDSSVVLGGYAVTGTSPVKTDSGKGGIDYWLVRFKYIDGMVGVEENSANNFLVFPNPTNNSFTIKNLSANNPYSLQILNLLGEVIYSEKLFGKSEYPININLSSGIYFVQVRGERKAVTQKLVVE